MKNLKQLIKETLQLFFGNIPIILLIVLPIAIPVEWVKNYFFVDYYESIWTTSRRDGLVELFFLSVIAPVVISYFHRKETGQPASLTDSFKTGFRKWPRIILYGIVKNVVIGAGLLLLVIPGIIFFFWLFFVDTVITLEGTKRQNPLTRSRLIARGHLLPIFVSVIVMFLIVEIPSFLVAFPLYRVIDAVWYDAYWIGDTLIDVMVDVGSVLYILLGLKLYMRITGPREEAPDAAPVRPVAAPEGDGVASAGV